MIYTRTRSMTIGKPEKSGRYNQSRSWNSSCSNPWSSGPKTELDVGTWSTKVTCDMHPSDNLRRAKQLGYKPSLPFKVTTTEYSASSNPLPHDTRRKSNNCLIGRFQGSHAVSNNFRAQLLRPDLSDASRARQWATNKACSNAIETAVDALTAFAESKQTAVMLKRTLLTLFGRAENTLRTIDAARRRRYNKPGQAAALLSDFNNLWLEARFGMRPLAYDILGVAEALSKPMKSFEEGKAKQTFNLDDSLVVDASIPGQLVLARYNLSGTATTRGYAIASILAGRSEFGSNPFKTGYELFPFSFLVDKVYDIGSVLGTMSSSQARIVDSCSSLKVEYTSSVDVTIEFYGSFLNPADEESGSGTNTYQETVQMYERTPQKWGAPVLNNRLNTLDWIDIASIAASKLKAFERLAHKLAVRP